MRSRWGLLLMMSSAVMGAAAVTATPANVAGASAALESHFQLAEPRAPSPESRTQGSVPTYSKDVAPIVQKNCQICHRPGEAGPFSLLTYADVRRRAAKIKVAVSDKVMPPWFADPHYGKFSNAMGLSASEI